MKGATRIAQGVGGWLQYEFACERSDLFSEKYLSSAIGQVLRAEYGDRVKAEIRHPILADNMYGRGRRPEVDFAIQDPYPNISVAVETKWHGKTEVRLQDIIWDLVRLELLVAAYGTTAYFVLAGKKQDLDRLFSKKTFLAPYPNRPGARPLLRVDQRRSSSLQLASPPLIRATIVDRALKNCNGTPIPTKVSTSKPVVYPLGAFNYQYQVYVWQILSSSRRTTFLPRG